MIGSEHNHDAHALYTTQQGKDPTLQGKSPTQQGNLGRFAFTYFVGHAPLVFVACGRSLAPCSNATVQ